MCLLVILSALLLIETDIQTLKYICQLRLIGLFNGAYTTVYVMY